MDRNARGRQGLLRWSVGSCFAATGFLGGFWLRPVAEPDWRGALSLAAVALVVLLGSVWRSRARAARRQEAALDTYAEQEIAKDRRRKSP